jgi:hypothetical protein
MVLVLVVGVVWCGGRAGQDAHRPDPAGHGGGFTMTHCGEPAGALTQGLAPAEYSRLPVLERLRRTGHRSASSGHPQPRLGSAGPPPGRHCAVRWIWTGRWHRHTIALRARSISVRFTEFSFGSVRVDGVTYGHDLIIDRGTIRKRKKAASRKFRGVYGHTPLSVAEDIPWRCRRLVIGTGADGALPVLKQVEQEARRFG